MDNQLTPQDQQLLQKLATVIARWHMGVLAIFLLEMYKPFAFVGSQFFLALGPLMQMFFAAAAYRRLVELLSDRNNVEYLLVLIEGAIKK